MTVFVDIDGTLAHIGHRLKKAGPEPRTRGKKYSQWVKAVQSKKSLLSDVPVRGMHTLIKSLHSDLTINIVYLTGRSEVYRDVTSEWLGSWGFPASPPLLMRPKRNRQSNKVLKGTLIKQYSGNNRNDYIIVIDDDYSGEIQELCKERGYTFLKAMSGGTY